MTLDGLTLHGLVRELDGRLRGARLQRIHQPLPHALALRLWTPQDRRELTLFVGFGEPPAFHLTEARLLNPLSPSSFCMLLRKHLKNGFVDGVAQDGLERLAELRVRRPDACYALRAELLGRHGNALLLKLDGAGAASGGARVLGAAVAGPRARPGQPYAPPPDQGKLDPRRAEWEHFCALPAAPDPLWRWLLAHLQGIGPRLARELALRSGLDPDVSQAGLGEADRRAVWDRVRRMFDDAGAGRFSPCVYARAQAAPEAAPFPLELHAGDACRPHASLNEALDACLQLERPAGEEAAERARLLKLLGGRVKKARTVLDRVGADLRRAEQFERIKREADLIMLHLGALAPGRRTTLEDPAGGEAVEVHIDPRRSPVEDAQHRYARYKKLKRGVAKLLERRDTLQRELDYLETAQIQVEQADTLADLDQLARELALEVPADPRRAGRGSTGRGSTDPEPSGPRRFEADGYVILVGRNSRQNDELTRNAHPEDLWLHARQRPGSHVVLKTNGDAGAVPDAVRLRAAQLAAYYSKGRHAAKVPVLCTRAKFLRKPKGAKPGLVLVTREEQTLVVAPAPEENA